MMVVTIVAFLDKFKPCHPVSKVKALHHAHLFQHAHRPINCDQITFAGG